MDPLESLLFATSVGVPSGVCDSVRSIRQATVILKVKACVGDARHEPPAWLPPKGSFPWPIP